MLKREISRTNVLVAAAGGMIGSGWLFSPFISAQIAGTHSLISWCIAFVFMIFIALPLCELGSMLPISGGLTLYPSLTHGHSLGFIFAWIAWLSYVVMTPIEIQAILQYGSYFFPSLVQSGGHGFLLSIHGYVLAAFLLIFLAIVNTYGVKFLAECNKYASIFKFLVPSIAIFSLFFVAKNMQNLQMNSWQHSDIQQIFSALSLGGVAFAFTGFQNGLMLAGEVEQPQKNIPIAILGALCIGFVLYFLLQLSFLISIPAEYVALGWDKLSFPGESGPLVGLMMLLGLSTIAFFLLIDSVVSPFGTSLVYTAATSRILYGMALNNYLPASLLRVNKYGIPTNTLWINAGVGLLSFLPFPGWPSMVAFLSSCSIISYGVGPICLLSLRKINAQYPRPFRLNYAHLWAYLAFYVCNLMLFWCGFYILWKLALAIAIGFVFLALIKPQSLKAEKLAVAWFLVYLFILVLLSYLGTFGGIAKIQFPVDMLILLSLSILFLTLSTKVCLSPENHTSRLNNLRGEL